MRHVTAELDIVVGSIITVEKHANRKQFNKEEQIAKQIQAQLAAAGVAFDFLRDPGREVWISGIETMGELYQLCRLAVYLENDKDIANVLSDGPVLPAELDSALINVWSGKSKSKFSHLVFLQGINSYYLPVAFEDPLWLPFKNEKNRLDEAFFGSARKLYEQLTALEVALKQAGSDKSPEAYRCLSALREASLQSINADLPLIIW